MIKNVLVPYVNANTEAGPLSTALAICEQFSAKLALLIAVDVPMPMPNEWVPISGDVYMRLREQLLESVQPLAQKMRDRFAAQNLDHRGVKTEVRVVESVLLAPSPMATMHAHYVDLIVVPSAVGAGADTAVAHEYFVNLLIGSGRPVLVVPPKHHAKVAPKRAVIAWQPSRETTRAVHDALPLLKTAELVDVLVIDPEVGEFAHGDQPGADVAAHLAAHGLKVQVCVRPRIANSIAASILQHAQEVGADLLVAGGYGHSRFREFMLGGVTRDLLRLTHLPVLFSH
jgi:nucleotide-binding universal stress UspA family protein